MPSSQSPVMGNPPRPRSRILSLAKSPSASHPPPHPTAYPILEVRSLQGSSRSRKCVATCQRLACTAPCLQRSPLPGTFASNLRQQSQRNHHPAPSQHGCSEIRRTGPTCSSAVLSAGVALCQRTSATLHFYTILRLWKTLGVTQAHAAQAITSASGVCRQRASSCPAQASM